MTEDKTGFKEIGSSFEATQYAPSKPNGFDELDNCRFLRCARECLLVIGRYHLSIHKKSIVLMPDICCASMVQPFYQLGYEVVYYKINECFFIDEDNLLQQIKKDSVLVVMDYFGISSCSSTFLKRIKKDYSLTIVEDFTHSFSHFFKTSPLLDFKLISIRKWLPVPDGAILFSRDQFDFELDKDDGFAVSYYSAMRTKSTYLRTHDSSLKRDYLEVFKKCAEYLKGVIIPTSISDISKTIINGLDISLAMKKRKKNYSYLFKRLSSEKNIQRIIFKKQKTPFCLPILVKEKRDELQKFLSERGVYCQVLWPLPSQCKPNGFNGWFSSHMLSIPCDQRYEPEDLSRIANLISDFYIGR